MGVITGIDAAINGFTCLSQFKIITSGLDNAIACSNSKGGVVRAATNYDWKGAAVGFAQPPPKLPGELFTFAGGDRAGQGWNSAADGAIVDRVRIICNPRLAKAIYWEMFFSANGSLTAGAHTATSSATPTPSSSKERGISIDGAKTGIGSWELEIDGNTAAPLWTADSGGWPKRAATGASASNSKSGNIDATMKWEQYFNAVSVLPVVGDFAVFGLYVAASTYWEIKWGEVLENEIEYVIRNEQNKPDWVKSTGEARFSGYYAGGEGWIKRPAGTTYWPAAA